MTQNPRPDECRTNIPIEKTPEANRVVPDVVRRLVHSCDTKECFEHVSPIPIPSRQAVVDVILSGRRVLFPGYFTDNKIDDVNLEYYLGQEVTNLFQKLSTQVTWAVRHDCFRYDAVECTHCQDQGRKKALQFIETLPEMRRVLATDVKAAYDGDPACRSMDQIIFSYPGLFAVTVYRMAHVLWNLDVPLLPRIMTEYAHSYTGIDIHPGATIGESFFIDHGTGVVIGETAEIGNQVRIYQGVTLGALSIPRGAGESMRGMKRHPTIEDDVIIYSGATILGGDTVIGTKSVIGGNVWLTESVPPETKVLMKNPELVFIGGNGVKNGKQNR